MILVVDKRMLPQETSLHHIIPFSEQIDLCEISRHMHGWCAVNTQNGYFVSIKAHSPLSENYEFSLPISLH
jgi:hypothetical protein